MAHLVGGGTPAVDNEAFWAHGNEGTPWVTISDLSDRGTVTETSRRLSDAGLAAARLSPAPVGTVLFSIYASVGLVSLLALPAVWNQAILGVIPRDEVLGRYLAYALQALRPSLSLHMRSNTQHNLNADTVRNLEFAIPSFDRQLRIADYLDAQTARIDALSSNAVRMKLLIAERLDREISRIAVDQSVAARRLRDLVDGIEVGVVVQPATLYAPSGIPFLRGMNVRPGALALDDLKYLDPAKESVAAKSRLRTGDVVVVRTGQAGAAVAIPPELDGANCVDLLIVRPGRRVVSEYLELLLNTEFVRSQVATLTVGSIQSHFNVGALRETLIPVPGVAVQREIVARAHEVRARHERLLAAIDRQIILLRERRQALMTAGVTGRLQVPYTMTANAAA